MKIQSAKILLVPPKYEKLWCHPTIIISIHIGLFSIAPFKVIDLKLLCFIYGISSLLLFFIALSKVITLSRT